MPLARFDTWVRSAVGPAAAGTQVYICTQPAVTSTIPPSPLAALFADSGQVTPIAQPLVADGFGHAYGYVASGTYTVVLVQYGLVQQVFPDQLIGSGAGSTLVLQTNGVTNTVQSLLNIQGAGSVSVSSDGVGGVTITGLAIGGSDTQVQYNSAGVVAGDADFEWDYTNKVLKIGDTSHPGAIKFAGITSGTVTVLAPTAPTPWSLTLPTGAGTSGQSLLTDGTGIASWGSPTVAFNKIGTGANTTATMTVGTGGTLTTSGSGIINASAIAGVSVSGTPNVGQVITATSSSAADWADITKISGVTVSGTPAIGQALVATSSSAADWQTVPAVIGGGFTKMQAGMATYVSGGTITISFPTTFTTLVSIVAQGLGGSCNIASASVSGATFNTSSVDVYWIAVGT